MTVHSNCVEVTESADCSVDVRFFVVEQMSQTRSIMAEPVALIFQDCLSCRFKASSARALLGSYSIREEGDEGDEATTVPVMTTLLLHRHPTKLGPPCSIVNGSLRAFSRRMRLVLAPCLAHASFVRETAQCFGFCRSQQPRQTVYVSAISSFSWAAVF
jgi:hypothetical protein